MREPYKLSLTSSVQAVPARKLRALSLGEGESQQARAEQDNSRCGEGKVAIGNEVLISHDTPSVLKCSSELDFRPLLQRVRKIVSP